MRILTFTIVLSLLSSSLLAALPVMPEGFVYPRVKKPRVSTRKCASCPSAMHHGFSVAEEDIIFQRTAVDPIDRKWAGRLLSIESGYSKLWSPEQVYQISLGGVAGFEKYAFASVERSMILFEEYEQLATGTVLRSINHPTFTLSRRADSLVLRRDGRRTWVFTSPDFGENWRLTRMGYAGHPGAILESGVCP